MAGLIIAIPVLKYQFRKTLTGGALTYLYDYD